MRFDWDESKNAANRQKHGVDFFKAQYAFADPLRIIAEDTVHSTASEMRYYCFGRVDGGIMTVRFVRRGGKIRIIGAGYWRKGKKLYETQND